MDRGTGIVDCVHVCDRRTSWSAARRPLVSEIRSQGVPNVASIAHDRRMDCLHGVAGQRE